MFYDYYRNYRYCPDFYPGYYPYRPYDWYNPYSPFYDNYTYAGINQNINNSGTMNDVQQNAIINQSVSRPHPRARSRS